jgi:hypothetical protein
VSKPCATLLVPIERGRRDPREAVILLRSEFEFVFRAIVRVIGLGMSLTSGCAASVQSVEGHLAHLFAILRTHQYSEMPVSKLGSLSA